MKICLTSYTGIGAWFLLRLLKEGHSCDYYQISKDRQNVLRGLVPTPLKEKPNYSKYDLSIFDLTGKPKLAEESAKTTPTLGDSELATQLEDDRVFGIEAMEQCGITVPEYEVFDSVEKAIKYVEKQKKGFYFKPSGGQDQSAASTYGNKDWKELVKYLNKLGDIAKGAEFILQEIIEGCEVSTEAWFNGTDFFLVNHTIEEKKFMNGNVGPATGCAGNLVWTQIDGRPNKIFTTGLEKLKQYLIEQQYTGMVDLNSIVTDQDLYGLEWTPRFGYDASSTFFSLIREGTFGDFLYCITSGEKELPANVVKEDWFAASVRISIPPYPTFIKGKHPVGIPISGIEEDQLRYIYLWDAMLDDNGDLVTCGEGESMVAAPISTSMKPEVVFEQVYEIIERIKIPDVQYRTDMSKYCCKRYNQLEYMGWLRP